MVTYFDDTHLIKFGATLGPSGGELATLRNRLAEGVPPDGSRGELGQVLNCPCFNNHLSAFAAAFSAACRLNGVVPAST